MRRWNRFRHFLAQFREQLRNDAVSRQPFAVFRIEKLFSNDATAIDEKISRPRKASLHPGRFRIQHAVGLDDFRVRVRQHRVIDLVAAGKELQDFFRVVADGRQLDALLFKSRDGALQLDQLPFAERSPVRRTKK
jgi:hypothetical protein